MLEDYEVRGLLYAGTDGRAVFAARHVASQTLVALKRVPVDTPYDEVSAVQEELQTRALLRHPNILPWLGAWASGRALWVAAPLQLRSIRDQLDQTHPAGLTERAAALILRDVLRALTYMHHHQIVHRGICGRHILLGGDGTCRVSGLRGAAKLRRGRLFSLPPPPSSAHAQTHLTHLAPEILQQNLLGYTELSDIYSVGALCCEIANGAVPFVSLPPTLLMTEKMRGARPLLLDSSTLSQHDSLAVSAKMAKIKRGQKITVILKAAAGLEKEKKNMDAGGDSGEGECEGVGGDALRRVYAVRAFTDHFHNFTEQALHREPARRGTAASMLQHPFMKQVRRTDHLPSLIAASAVNPQPPPAHGDAATFFLQEQLADMDVEKTVEWDF